MDRQLSSTPVRPVRLSEEKIRRMREQIKLARQMQLEAQDQASSDTSDDHRHKQQRRSHGREQTPESQQHRHRQRPQQQQQQQQQLLQQPHSQQRSRNQIVLRRQYPQRTPDTHSEDDSSSSMVDALLVDPYNNQPISRREYGRMCQRYKATHHRGQRQYAQPRRDLVHMLDEVAEVLMDDTVNGFEGIAHMKAFLQHLAAKTASKIHCVCWPKATSGKNVAERYHIKSMEETLRNVTLERDILLAELLKSNSSSARVQELTSSDETSFNLSTTQQQLMSTQQQLMSTQQLTSDGDADADAGAGVGADFSHERAKESAHTNETLRRRIVLERITQMKMAKHDVDQLVLLKRGMRAVDNAMANTNSQSPNSRERRSEQGQSKSRQSKIPRGSTANRTPPKWKTVVQQEFEAKQCLRRSASPANFKYKQVTKFSPDQTKRSLLFTDV